MARPEIERGAHLGLVTKTIVDPGNASEGVRRVIENPLDDVRRDTEPGETGGRCSAQIMQRPTRDAGVAVKFAFGFPEP